jgi:hypothetical protein
VPHPSIFRTLRRRSRGIGFRSIALLVSGLLVGGEGLLLAQEAAQQEAPPAETAPKLSGDQLEALVAPIALYPDDLLAQCLVASTYPIEVIQAQQWLDKNKNLKGDALSEAAMDQDWDPSIQALVSIPDALKVLAQDVKWTTDLGDAFLAQQSEVMDAVQRLRLKAKDSGKLASSEQQKVETQVIEDETIVVIQPVSTEVIYVPAYSPSVIWGVGYYPYPPLYYPPYYGGAWLGFGVGVAVGIGIAGGWGCGWHRGGNTININNNNNFVRNSNRGQASPRSGTSNWQHNSQHRGGAPYNNKATASKYGGSARGESRGGGSSGSGAFAGPSASSRDAGASRGGSSGFSGGGGDRVGGRDISSGGYSGSGFSGSSGGSHGASMSSSRGSASWGGGGMRGGGGRRR